MKLRRGFKADSERLSSELRAQMGIAPHGALLADALIAHLKVLLVGPEQIPHFPPEMLRALLNEGANCWSAFTFYDQTGQPIIINNPTHAPPRRESDLMHEVAHILCKHKTAKLGNLLGSPSLALRTYNAEQEEEAKYLGGCLQITRKGLIWAIDRRMTNTGIAEHFGASEALARYRRNITGVDMQFTRHQQNVNFAQ